MSRVKCTILCCVVLGSLTAGGCQPHNTVLNSSNYLQKFDQIELASQTRAGQLVRNDIESILGPGYEVKPGDPITTNFPPGHFAPELDWWSWAYNNETIVVGFSKDHATSISRLRL